MSHTTRAALGAVIVITALCVSSTASAAPGNVPHLQFRPVVARATDSRTAPPSSSGSAIDGISSCDTSAVLAFGPTVQVTASDKLKSGSCVVLSTAGGTRYLLGPSALDATGVDQAKAEFVPGQGWIVHLTLTRDGAQSFNALAERQFHKQFAIVANGKVLSAPTVMPDAATFSSFGNSAQISGSMTSREAKELATSVNRWRKTG